VAQDAKVRVRVDVEDAKRSMDEVNDRLRTTKERGSSLASSIRGLSQGVAAGAATIGGIADQAAGGGFLQAVGNTALGGAGEGYRRIAERLGFDANGLGDLSAEDRALERAGQAVESLVGAGGNISPAEIDRLLGQFTDLYEPGEKNIQNVRTAVQARRGETVGETVKDFLESDFAAQLGKALIGPVGNAILEAFSRVDFSTLFGNGG